MYCSTVSTAYLPRAPSFHLCLVRYSNRKQTYRTTVRQCMPPTIFAENNVVHISHSTYPLFLSRIAPSPPLPLPSPPPLLRFNAVSGAPAFRSFRGGQWRQTGGRHAPTRETAPCNKRIQDGTTVQAALYDGTQAPVPSSVVTCSAATASIAACSATAFAFAAACCDAR